MKIFKPLIALKKVIIATKSQRFWSHSSLGSLGRFFIIDKNSLSKIFSDMPFDMQWNLKLSFIDTPGLKKKGEKISPILLLFKIPLTTC